MKANKRKWRPGRAVTSIDDFLVLSRHGSLFYWNTDRVRPKHFSVIQNMAFISVKNAICHGRLYVAEQAEGGKE